VVVGVALMLTGENSRTVTAGIRERLAAVARTLPPGVTIEPFYDRSELIDRTIRTAVTNLSEGALLVVVVLFVLLGDLRAGLIVASAIPLAMLVAIIGMWSAGVSGNLMSLGAIDFGLIVDGAVIIIENASRRLGERRQALGRPLDPAERDQVLEAATLEVRRATIFGEAAVAVVYLPVLALTGIEGKLFRPMAATVLFALSGAFLLSLTLIPVLASYFLRAERAHEAVVVRWAHRFFDPALGRVQRHPAAVVLGALLIVATAIAGATRLGAEFIPTLDEGWLSIEAHKIPGTGLTTSVDIERRLHHALGRLPEVESVISRIGAPRVANDPMGLEQSDVYIRLRPRGRWRPGVLKADLARAVSEAMAAATPEVSGSISQPIQDRTNELLAGVRADVALHIFGPDLEELRRLGERAGEILRQVPGAAGVKVEAVAGQPYLRILPDRARLARQGLTVADVSTLTQALAVGYQAGLVFEGQERHPLVVRVALPPGGDPAAVSGLGLKTPDGRVVPLGDLAEVKLDRGPTQIGRAEGSRKISVGVNVDDRDTVGFVEEAMGRLDRELRLPPGYHLRWGGTYQHYQDARRRLFLIVPLALGLIGFILYLSFGEVVPALVIFLNVPFAITGGVAALAARGLPLSISAAIGFIALFGVAVLNGVVLLSVAHSLEASGVPPGEAAAQAARRRLRPVLMTALVAVLGFVPMALSTAPGSEVQRPLATVVIGGLISSTILTLFVLPTVYGLLRRRR
jgi:cobalt-zinc-cadmium resistance protein CzcA